MYESDELIPGLPQDIALECLTRLHYSAHRVATRVCKPWRDLLQSRDFYFLRKQTCRTQKAACLVQSLPGHPEQDVDKPGKAITYGVSLFDPVTGAWDCVEPVPEYSNGLPLFCHVISSEGKLVVMGGWDPVSYNAVRDVFVYEFTTRSWRRGKEMPDERSFFAAGEMEGGRIIVAGGHDESKNALSTAWVYHMERNEWDELSRMSQERDECEGVVIGSRFWVVSGYKTESQGSFEGSAECYDFETGEWERVENAWDWTQCPRSCTGVGKQGRLFNWAESDSAIRVGLCAIDVGEKTLLSGSACQGGLHGFFMVEGQKGKFQKIEVADEFAGLVQSGCFVEI